MAQTPQSPAYKDLKAQLATMFQMDRGDLDFGIYRIMKIKRKEVSTFLDNRLPKEIRKVLGEYRPLWLNGVEQELADADRNPTKFSPAYTASLRQKLVDTADIDRIEEQIYSHLCNFFKRYYDEGDFMALRRYKDGVYALPYAGEEVKLHWANHDQYYIKTSEDFKHYSFTVGGDMVGATQKVRFEIKAASTENGNNKEAKGKERRFMLAEEDAIQGAGDQLTIYFEFRNDGKARSEDGKMRSQDKINGDTIASLRSKPEYSEFRLHTPAPTEGNPNRTVLEKHLALFTAKNSFDFFIHKDLGGFLRRELDFFIKNEIMQLDDIENESAPTVESYLAEIRALRKSGHEIIDFLTQLEEFQKNLWLKKKFVIATDYCITLDHIIGTDRGEELLAAIVKNDAQRQEWVNLFAIDAIKGELETPAYSVPLTVGFLKANDKLPVDTRFFSAEFKYNLLSQVDDLDSSTDGLLINSENFQALNLLQARYQGQVKCIYIDPPFNTGDDFLYKDNFQNSSWISLLYDRISASNFLLNEEGSLYIHLDENANFLGRHILENMFSGITNEIVWNKGFRGTESKKIFQHSHDTLYYVQKNRHLSIWNDPAQPYKDKNLGRYNKIDENGKRYALVKRHKTDGEVYYGKAYPKEGGKSANDVISHIPTMASTNSEREKGFETQKPKELLKFLINAVCSSQSVILDYFAGSGTTGHAVINLNREDGGSRKYILVEMGNYFATVTKPRVLKAAYADQWKGGKPTSRQTGVSQIIKTLTLESYEDTLNNLADTLTETRHEESQLFAENDEAYADFMLNYMLPMDSDGAPPLLNIPRFENAFDYRLDITRGDETKPIAIDLIESFNYLIGLRVKKIKYYYGGYDRDPIVTVEGINPSDEKCLIIWRNIHTTDNQALDAWFQQTHLQGRPWARAIFVNGDNNLESLKPDGQQWEIRLIEEEFKHRMFDTDDV